MSSKMMCGVVASALFVSGLSAVAQGKSAVIEPRGAARPANSNGVYQALRSVGPAGDGVLVKDLTLQREGGVFQFAQGSFYFYGAVNGVVTGAVFSGSGHFTLSPKAVSEQRSLALLTKSNSMEQDFSTLVLRFTDGTADEIRKASAGTAGAVTAQAGQAAASLAKDFRTTVHENYDIRLLSDLLAGKPGHLFMASFRMGGALTGRNVLFTVDPQEVPDQVALSTWNDEGVQPWAAYSMEGTVEDKGFPAHVSAQKLDVEFEKSGKMSSSAEATLTVRYDGLRVVPLNLYPTLRVSGVYDENGDPLEFIQESKDRDPQFAVVLAKPAAKGSTVRLLTKYAGPDALRHDGSGMYYLLPGARESWYPSGEESLGGFADYRMTFHLPKGLDIVATGKRVSSEAEGGGQRVVWATDSPIAVAGFNLGTFKTDQLKTPDGFMVQAYANTELPDSLTPYVEQMNLGSMSTTSALKYEVSKGSAAIQIYSDYFGKLPYDHVALTEQSACNYGQSWPMLVYLPICGFWDSTIQQRLGLLDFGGASYWKEVTPHEVAHQWWGQEVGFNSYRDQWMSEGFASFSVSLYLAATNKNLDEFNSYWKDQHKNLVEKNQFGVRPIDVGPLTMGGRVSNEKTGDVYQKLIYSKGAYVMHMLQVMYFTQQYGEAPFKHSMQEFVKEYSGKPATTEDLKASFERTMPKWMDLMHDGKLDWFFNEYVYGTELPHYDLASDFTTADGETTVHFKLAQSKVSDNFVMLMPIYLQMQDGKTVRIFNVSIKGDTAVERTIKLGKLPAAGKKLLINYHEDILTD
jgi:hypothetical protein